MSADATVAPNALPSELQVASGLTNASMTAVDTDADTPAVIATDPPLGRWRLANASEVDHVMLWLSHILIRHEQVTFADDVPFNHAHWRFVQTQSTRSRASALQEARAIADQARKHPAQFAALAREFSEDPVTSTAGGSLGGIMALMFAPWPHFLDLFAETPVGQVSRVIESGHGFHVFFRRSPPPEQQVSGERVVIAHDEAPLIQVAARHSTPRRSRPEARDIAWRVYEAARERPDQFHELVERYSDHNSAASGGDLGSWSTHEITPLAREVEALTSIGVGDVAPPLDTAFGWQILKRTPNRVRHQWAMKRLELRFDPEQPAATGDSQAASLVQARSALASIKANPEMYEQLEKQYCCSNVLRVNEGRFSPVVEAALAGLKPGEVAPEPVLYGPGVYLIIKRLADNELPPAVTARFELPSPREPDMKHFLATRPTKFIEQGIRSLGDKAVASLALSADAADEILRLHAAERYGEVSADDSFARFTQLSARVRELLPPSVYARYEALSRQHFEELMYTSGIWASSEN